MEREGGVHLLVDSEMNLKMIHFLSLVLVQHPALAPALVLALVLVPVLVHRH